MDKTKYIAVEGPIGVGTTSLAKRLAETLKGRLVLEEPAENPLLPEFYKHKEGSAFKTQLFFLLARYEQQRALSMEETFSPYLISDYMFMKDRIFATLNLTKDEMFLYDKMYKLFDVQIRKPDLVLYLHSDTDVLVKHIKKRGLAYEKGIDSAYIEKVAEAYNQFFFSYSETPLLVANCSRIDFVNSEVDYENLVREIMQARKGQNQYVAVGGE
jgi:deoxyguanosine kinase